MPSAPERDEPRRASAVVNDPDARWGEQPDSPKRGRWSDIKQRARRTIDRDGVERETAPAVERR